MYSLQESEGEKRADLLGVKYAHRKKDKLKEYISIKESRRVDDGNYDILVEWGVGRDIASWIYPIFMKFIESLSLSNVSTDSYLEENNDIWDKREISFNGTILGQEFRIIQVTERKDRLFLDIYCPLTMKTDIDRTKKDDLDIFYNLRQISLLGISALEETFLNIIKDNEPSLFLDRYRLLPMNVVIALPKDTDLWMYYFNLLIECDFVDEEEYRVGGSIYKRAEKEFRSYQ